MALTTFGAIMGFAAEMVQKGEEVYRAALERAENPGLREVLQDLLAEQGKNRSLMERTRREHVTEMILEPISGLHQEEYAIDVEISPQAKDADLLRAVLIREEGEMRFFKECSAKIPLPEVAGIFRKVSRKKESSIAKLKDLTLE